ncbi:MAG: 30S ribosomal protein S17 [bacterium]
MSEAKKISRKFKGVVTSDKMDKTIVVKVETLKLHPIYKKQYKSSRKYKVDDQKEQYKVGDVVEFAECRPLSRDKRWRVI